MKPRYFYKLVSPELTSARVRYWDEEHNNLLAVQYKVGEFVTPKLPNSKLMVFKYLKHAIAFKQEDELIFRCEVINPKKGKSVCWAGYFLSVKEFWELNLNKKVAPTGTYFVDAVKLMSEVKLT
jgi:hypothetical protein